MYPNPVPAPGGLKPILQGVRNKQRKGVQKANAKFEPQAFRDQLIKHLEGVAEGDFDAVAQKLDALGNQLDYRKYEQEFFEILLVGGLLAPGGGFLDDGSAKSTFSVTGSAKEPVEVPDVKKIVEVFNKLLRRYKYLQKPFEETALRGILQYTNKFTPVEREKLAVATALFVGCGLASANILTSLKKDHLVKDSTSLAFLTTFLKSYLATESVEHLSSSLRKGGVTDLEAYFPPARQTGAELTAHFKANGLAGVVDFYTKQKSGKAKEELVAVLSALVADDADEEEISAYLEEQHKNGGIPDAEFIALVWTGLLSSFDMTGLQTAELLVKETSRISPILETLCIKPTTEVALINTIQVWCHDNTKAMPTFPKLLKVLYSKDVLSDQSIIYWHSKGSKSQGRQSFLASTDPLVTFLKEQEDEEDSDEE